MSGAAEQFKRDSKASLPADLRWERKLPGVDDFRVQCMQSPGRGADDAGVPFGVQWNADSYLEYEYLQLERVAGDLYLQPAGWGADEPVVPYWV